MSCRTPDGKTAQGEGEYTGVGSAEVRGRYTMTSQYQGQPLKMDSQSVSKWLGSDCSKPPGRHRPQLAQPVIKPRRGRWLRPQASARLGGPPWRRAQWAARPRP